MTFDVLAEDTAKVADTEVQELLGKDVPAGRRVA